MQVVSMKIAREWWEKLQAFLLEHVNEIYPIHAQGGIAMVFWDAEKEWIDDLEWVGYKGETVWRMPARLRYSMQTADSVTKRWIRRKKGPHRIFVVNGKGSMLINVSKAKGMCVEPGSMDHELAEELGLDLDTQVVLHDEEM